MPDVKPKPADKLSIVAINLSTHDAAFQPIRALAPGRVEVVHARYQASWEEVSARRSGHTWAEPEQVSDELLDALGRAEVVFGFLVPRRLPELAPHLRWVATPATGVDQLRGTAVLESDHIIVTNAGGLFGPLIAEHVLAMILYFAKRLRVFDDQRQKREWNMSRVQALAGRTLGVVGVGGIGVAVAQLGRTLGMRVLGVGRTAAEARSVPAVHQLYSRNELHALLAASDYVVLAVADTPETRAMIGVAELAAMRPSAVLVNVARGTVIDEAALVEALRKGTIAGAGLDVFAHEPLPTESPLWELPNVLLTPHVAASVEDYLPRAIEQFKENVGRYLRGEALANVFDRSRGY
jgi:phosphoglycerate dehydrogenase-like enzyme